MVPITDMLSVDFDLLRYFDLAPRDRWVCQSALELISLCGVQSSCLQELIQRYASPVRARIPDRAQKGEISAIIRYARIRTENPVKKRVVAICVK